jgi:hypothetical protein
MKMLGKSRNKKTDDEVVKDWGNRLAAEKDAKNVSDLKEIQSSINALKLCKFKGFEKVLMDFQKVFEERTLFVMTRYKKEGWEFKI